MSKVCIQAGHKNMTTGSTGAPGERDWTTKIMPMVASRLKAKGITVYETDAFGNDDSKVTGTDWDLFISIHYDADIYKDRGGFTDCPDPSIDYVHTRSKELAKKISDVFFQKMGIPVKSRSNANTKFYYMWQFLTANTPCVIIECGVGYRQPEDYNVLRRYDEVATALSDAISSALGVTGGCEAKLALLEESIVAKDKEIVILKAKVDELVKISAKWDQVKKLVSGK